MGWGGWGGWGEAGRGGALPEAQSSLRKSAGGELGFEEVRVEAGAQRLQQGADGGRALEQQGGVVGG